MNYNFNDKEFQNTDIYKKFIEDNPKVGYLKIRASAANSAVPIENLKVVVSKNIDGNNVIFFEGLTNNSGVIEKITLPAPVLNSNDLTVPNSTSYDIKTIYEPDNITGLYQINIYDNLYVIQNINIVPKMINRGLNNGG